MNYKKKECSYVYRDTPCGKIKGLRKDGFTVYKGVRFASAERWEAPEVVTSWDGELDATKAGKWCYQHESFFETENAPYLRFFYNQTAEKVVAQYSEDCLNMSIWVPDGAENAPVAVFVHGGSFVSGGNGASYVMGDEYCKRGIIFAAINYRMNAFTGVYEEGRAANFSLRDQMAAFIWLKQNIAAFGGDANRIVAIGESAGALSLQCMLYSPQAKGLLAGAVMMSGGGFLEDLYMPTSHVFPQRTANLMKEKFGVSSIAQLKDIPPKDIYVAWLNATNTDTDLANQAAKPSVDGDIIPKPINELIKSDELNDIPCIFGFSSEDMWPYILYTSAIKWAAHRSKAGKKPIYGYYMDRQLPGDDAGAHHACDLWYMFGALDKNWRPFTEIDYRISENLIDYVAEFVKTGNPNNGKLPQWQPLTYESSKFLRLGDDEAAMYQPPVEQLKNAKQNTQPFPGM